MIENPIEIISKHYLSIKSDQNKTIDVQLKQYIELFHTIIEEATNQDYVNFTTLFSRIAYLGSKFDIPKHILSYAHQFRKGFEAKLITSETISFYTELGEKTCGLLMAVLWQQGNVKDFLLTPRSYDYFKPIQKKYKKYTHLLEVLISEVDTDMKRFLFYDDEDAIEPKTAIYNIHDHNETFTPSIEVLKRNKMLPIHANLLECSIDEDGNFIPQAIVIHPDFLVDVTSIAECFKENRTEPFIYLLNKFKPRETSDSLLVGNMVNVILDELVANPSSVFDDVVHVLFKADPLTWAALDDDSTKRLLADLKDHFRNLQASVNQAFGLEQIGLDHIYLEPSFYSRDYGVQGRLDLLHLPSDRSHSDIIELKSGKTFKPNAYNINESHYIQTLVYDLMITSALEIQQRKNYILYSKYPPPNLRHAPVIKPQQNEAIKLRNQLISIEWLLQNCQAENSILTYIKESNFPHFKGFLLQDVKTFYGIYSSLDSVEKAYFEQYVAFVSREHNLSRTGEHGVYKSNGHAALWLETAEEKKDRFALLSDLSIKYNQSNTENATIVFEKNQQDNTLVNLRKGDIAVLYPSNENHIRPVLKSQIFKCSIIDISNDTITVKLRSKQNNQNIFKSYKQWNLEQDSLDSTFNSMYRSLFSWAAADISFRKLILGRTKPLGQQMIEIDANQFEKKMTNHQVNVLKEMIRSRDFYLLWGPPGTRKTSVMLKNLVLYLYNTTTTNILLIAYTNRAVDEICEANQEVNLPFIRIGSSNSTDPKFHGYLLDQKVSKLNRRHEIVNHVQETRIFVSTVASIVSRPDIFALKEFDTVIIDEASQILEPMIVGFLSKFKRCILIGDHQQLPAVVTQNPIKSRINNAELQAIHIYDTRTSFFERMYMQAESRGDFSRMGILREQGRMHADIMSFVNKYFYDGQLEAIPQNPKQTALSFFEQTEYKYLKKRMYFFNTDSIQQPNWKTNEEEADKIISIIAELIKTYEQNQMILTADSIGVITPYRAQIALIRHKLESSILSQYSSLISIDTVERYQGGARDIIIISFCVNRLSQLNSLVSPSLEGTDRKLNVALTRAREHVIMYGNKDILGNNDVYKALIEWCE
jgi:DNA replication ATP-dependent helicase Dna2